jgi:uncharacterized coiled-coil protein SlyX
MFIETLASAFMDETNEMEKRAELVEMRFCTALVEELEKLGVAKPSKLPSGRSNLTQQKAGWLRKLIFGDPRIGHAQRRVGRLQREADVYARKATSLRPVVAEHQKTMAAGHMEGTHPTERVLSAQDTLAERRRHQAERLARVVKGSKPVRPFFTPGGGVTRHGAARLPGFNPKIQKEVGAQVNSQKEALKKHHTTIEDLKKQIAEHQAQITAHEGHAGALERKIGEPRPPKPPKPPKQEKKESQKENPKKETQKPKQEEAAAAEAA